MNSADEWTFVTGCQLNRHEDGLRIAREIGFELYAKRLERKGERQVQCRKCHLWMFDSERCGLFETMKS